MRIKTLWCIFIAISYIGIVEKNDIMMIISIILMINNNGDEDNNNARKLSPSSDPMLC
jgi:hypothetical protein